jgi:hypothetical protein
MKEPHLLVWMGGSNQAWMGCSLPQEKKEVIKIVV